VATLEATGKLMAAAGMATNLAVVVILVLKVWKPGV
jgi:hypothetical protein